MFLLLCKTVCHMAQTLGRTKRFLRVVKIRAKYDNLKIQEKHIAHRVNKTNINLETTPCKREVEERRLNVATMHIKKQT